MTLTQIMQDRVTVLEQIFMVSEKQHTLIQENDVTTLLKVLMKKQTFLTHFERLERSLDPFRGIDPADRTWKNEQERMDCAKAMAQCEELLARILELDRKSETVLAGMKQQTQWELKRLDNGAKAASAYARQNIVPQSVHTTSSSRFDFKSE